MASAKRKAEFVPDDETLEYAAQLIEDASLADLRGVFAKRKRDREDAALRHQTTQEARQEMARHIRAMKGRRDLDAPAVLLRIAEECALPDQDRVVSLVDAWPLAWKGWLEIEARIRCTSNSIPPETHYHISITDEGREVLRAHFPDLDTARGEK